ncbi:MAG: glycosyltransferase family 39 protein [Lachnospiraceae bacterium]|nr:glycosyltransferase family 39 protein [Lachnospiraceae bacterium]
MKIKFDFKKEENKRALVYAAAVFAILLWIPLSITKSVAYDQSYTVAMVRHSFSEIITLCSYDVHSPLYYFIAKVFYDVLFKQIFALKICSLCFMAFYMWILAFPFRKEFGNRMAFCMIVLSTFLPTFQTHNTEPRMYSMAIASYTAVAFLSYKIFKEFKIKYAVLFFIASVFSTYIHTYTMLATVFLYFVMAVAVIVKKDDRKKRIIWFLINAALVSVSYLPWLFSLFSQFGAKGEFVSDEFNTVFYIKDLLYENFSNIMIPKNREVIAWLVILLFTIAVLIVKKTPYIGYILTGLGIYVATAAIGIYLSVNKVPCFMGRYVSCIMPLILFAIAAALDRIKIKYIVAGVLAFAVLAGALIYRDRIRYEFDDGINKYIAFVEENFTPDDAVMYGDIHNDCLSIFAPDTYTFIYGYKDEFNPFSNDETFIDLSQFDKVTGDIWLVIYDYKNPGWFLDCDYDKVYGFHYLYYDVSIYKIYNFRE